VYRDENSSIHSSKLENSSYVEDFRYCLNEMITIKYIRNDLGKMRISVHAPTLNLLLIKEENI
jgi:hypothetical protein